MIGVADNSDSVHVLLRVGGAWVFSPAHWLKSIAKQREDFQWKRLQTAFALILHFQAIKFHACSSVVTHYAKSSSASAAGLCQVGPSSSSMIAPWVMHLVQVLQVKHITIRKPCLSCSHPICDAMQLAAVLDWKHSHFPLWASGPH